MNLQGHLQGEQCSDHSQMVDTCFWRKALRGRTCHMHR